MESLSGLQPQTIRETDPRWRAPMLFQIAAGVERQVSKKITLSSNFIHTNGTHALRSRNINAPLPSGLRPFSTGNSIYHLQWTFVPNLASEVLVPLLALAIPLFKYIPQLIEFKQKSRLNRCYGLLLDMEHQIRSKTLNPEEAAAATDKLDRIERDVSSMKFPLDFTDRVYTLRQHVDYVRGQLLQRKSGAAS